VGCEVFVVDSGWYGVGEGSWEDRLGDFRERTDGAFYGKMREFAQDVRAAGLGFGLWVEPERLGKSAPILSEHPDWFRKAPNGFWYPALEKAEARQYMQSLVEDLIERYDCAGLKSTST
jgi:alpha-galactosidase